ncbi:MAG: peptide chain release factor N(5)-glutamine methyltransferase [Candidatus Omnitrophica bacterium]|nr:peptide chain release factor N(5)-glutamine methyltransferase [Candidatus Omnitrophota bacterium]MDD5351898.1 peptide chain release factor N(5)-glutamine methyltransferase [Candidatus Omnitrophota bacterium]MDD5550724.1 peptide chain release factor N(5)-glutamine methyltransferase [Candidatus Omnitrophota bacterium]
MNELELILTDIFNCSRADLYLNAPAIAFKEKDFRFFDRVLKNRIRRQMPVQYLLGYAEFMGLRIKVDRNVLIPRPETEVLVEAVIEKNQKSKIHPEHGIPLMRENQKLRILDIGTGSGCIAIALAKFIKAAEIFATDISKTALSLARENAKLHKVEERIRFLRADIFTPLEKSKDKDSSLLAQKFDIIVSNPPYVPTSEIGLFDVTVTNEPRIALDGGTDGLIFYKRISEQADGLLKKGGLLFLELGEGQAEEIKEIFFRGWIIQELKKDYQGTERVCVIKRK